MRAAMNFQVPNLEFLGLLNSCYFFNKASALWNLSVTIFNEYIRKESFTISGSGPKYRLSFAYSASKTKKR
jgi:hypothetical protein